jgi:hypothetical protein
MFSHTWQIDRFPDFPFGPPQLMVSITSDQQLNQSVLKEHNQLLNIDSNQKKQSRESAGIEYAPISSGCDLSNTGECFQFVPTQMKVKTKNE